MSLPSKGAPYLFETALTSQANPDVFQLNPTLVAGDATVSKDGGAFSNITALPVAIGAGRVLTVSLTASEMNADRVAVLFHDQAGNEWCDRLCCILIGQTTVAFPTGGITFTYTVTNALTGAPLQGIEVWISTDSADPPVNIVWKGTTDSFGVARSVMNELPCLNAGTYYFWRKKPGFTFEDPDSELVS